ncbi:hypothetical protein Q5O14_17295 [Eubacteriaceae bacterium ES2]|nr:hypothetical protein Q5O14_17295 [Eubacteriaceae bacterium ES2]
MDKELTLEIKVFARNHDMDIFGISGVEIINQHARKGRRPKDLYPKAQTVLVFGCGIADPFCRGWVCNGKGGEYFSLTSNELANHKFKLISFLNQKGYQSFGGQMHGGGLLHSGIRLANVAENCGLGYIGKNNLLITKKYGPRLNLGFLATDAPLIPDEEKVENECGNCRVCEHYCSSGAIMGDFYFNARQCEAVINCRPNKLYYSANVNQDCDMCMRMCPKGEIYWEKEERQGTWFEKIESTGEI